MAAQAAEIIPLVDLRLLSQAEITSIAASCPNAFDLRRCDDVVVPKIDRSVFNESAGSRKQTYSRLRLAPHKPDPAAPSIVASRRPRGLFSPPPSSSTAIPADPSLAEAGNADDDDPGHRENLQIVSYLRQLFAQEALAPRTLSVSTPIIAPGNPSSFIGSGSKDPGGSAVAMIVVEDADRVVMNGKGETVDLVALGQRIDPFTEELRRRTVGLTTEEQLLVYLNGLDGQWGSQRRRRKIVDASEFGDHLPRGWKLLLSLKRKEGDIWVYCRRYISPCGKHFSSCKDVSSYIFTLLGNPTVLPESVGNNASVPRPDEMITEYAASAFVQENILEEKPNCSVVAHFSSSSINNEMQIMSPNTVNQHQLSCQQRSLKRRKLGKSIVEGVIMKDGKFECQFCHKMFAERQRYNGHIGAHVRFQGLTAEAMPAEGNSSKLSCSVRWAAVSCGFSPTETKEKICTPEIADELHASANLQHQVEGHEIDLNFQGAETSKIAPNVVDAVKLPVIHMEDEKAAEETSVTAADNRVDDYCHKAEETSEASEVKNDKASDEKITEVSGIEVVKPCIFKRNDTYKSNDVDASNFMIDEPNSARANDHDTSCYGSEIVPDTSKDVQLRSCLEVTSEAPVEVLNATCETMIEGVQNFPKSVSIDCKSSDFDFTVFKPNEIVETNNGMVIKGNCLENSASLSLISVDNVVCQSSNEKDASSAAISEIEKHSTEQKIDSEKDIITLSDNDSGYFICSGATDTFISNIRENALAGNENSTRKTNLNTSFTFPNADIVAKSILPMELNASGTSISFVNEPTVSSENRDYTFDVNRSMLGEIDCSKMEVERCYNGSIAANEEVDATNSLDVDLTLSSPWIHSSDHIPVDDMTVDLYEDGGIALGEKKSSDFDRRALNAVESSEFVRLSGQDTISLPDHSIGLGYIPGLNNDACPAVHLGWDISLQNSAYELTSICVWCSREFSHAATSAEEVSDTLGFICPSCKAKISGGSVSRTNQNRTIIFNERSRTITSTTTVVLWPAAQLCSSVPRIPRILLHHHLHLSISAPRRNMSRRCLVTCFSFAKENEEEEPSHGQPWHTFTLRELVHATRNFHGDNKLGEGGFGAVYWGRTKKGVEIAVKRLKAGEMTPKAEMEFAMEVEILGRVRHKNLLTLKGYLADGDERLIVYDYMPNRSLQSHLHGHRHRSSSQHPPLDWPRRMEIAIGAAEGIAYLHHEARPHVIHRDIKASNVLLDADFSAKVADFGFAKLVPEGASHVSTRVKGTLGYLAPEYAMWGKVAESCDVYSFGVLLLEIVSARRPIEKLPGGGKREIAEWAAGLAERGAWERIADPRLGARFERGELENAVEVALRCVDGRPERRPTMREVVEMLRGQRVVGAREEAEDGPSEPPRFARKSRKTKAAR